MDDDHAELIQKFMSMTETDEVFARSFLEGANWNLAEALDVILDGASPPEPGGSSAGAAAASSRSQAAADPVETLMREHGMDRATAEAVYAASGGAAGAAGAAGEVGPDGVRAPIQQKRARLFDLGFPGVAADGGDAGVGGDEEMADDRMDADERDAQEAFVLAQMARFAQNRPAAQPVSALASIAAPPRAIMFAGNFDAARERARQDRRWILVNIQDESDFRSFVLNRDLWSNDMVQSVIMADFLFWQRPITSEEGRRFAELYRVNPPYPFVGIVDPRTGELLRPIKLAKATEGELRMAFNEQALEFLDSHSFKAGSRGAAAAAAGAAGAAGGRPAAAAPAPAPAPVPAPQRTAAGQASSFARDADEDEELAAAIAASMRDVGGRGAGSASQPAGASASPAGGQSSRDPNAMEMVPPRGGPPAASASASASASAPAVPVPPQPEAGDANGVAVQFRFPDGSRDKRRFFKTDTVAGMFAYVASLPQVAGREFELIQSSATPPRNLGGSRDETVGSANLANTALLVRFVG